MTQANHLIVNFWSLTINAEGLWAVMAAVAIVMPSVVALKFRR